MEWFLELHPVSQVTIALCVTITILGLAGIFRSLL